jgi:parallel beta-helix repeat protein
MANLTSVQIKDSYQSVLTTSETTSNPTTGTLQNGKGSAITTLTVSGTVNATTLGGTLSTASQPNVTSVGTLTGLTTGTTRIVNATGAFTASNYLTVEGSTANNNNYPGIELKGGSAVTTYPQIRLGNGGNALNLTSGFSDIFPGKAAVILNVGTIALQTGTTLTNRVLVDASGVVELTQGQIKFPATQVASADANTLDDYEEGTWTPAGNGITFTTPEGHYTKIGNVVTVVARVTFPNTANASSALIQGLPFTGKDNMTAGSIGLTNYGSSDIIVTQAGASFLIRTYSNVILTNANLSEKFIYCSATYNI